VRDAIYKPRVLLEREGFASRRRRSQNFLCDRGVARAIVDVADLTSDDEVVEVGPGFGALTAEIVSWGAGVIAVELDRGLAKFLKEAFADEPLVRVLEGNALHVDYEQLAWVCGGRIKVISNLPYHLTSPLLFRLLDCRAVVLMVLTMQGEVARRLTAVAGSAEYGALSVTAGMLADAEIVRKISPGCFYPRPEVDSAVVKLKPLAAPRHRLGSRKAFRRVVKAAFGTRRKTLRNALKGAELPGVEGLSPEEFLRGANIDPRRRGETLSLEEFATLSRALHALHNEP